MRKTKKIQINDIEYTIKELTIRQIMELKNEYVNLDNLASILDTFLVKCSDIPKDSLQDFTFTDLENIVIAIKEVNISFFKIPGHLGLKEVADQMIDKIKAGLLKDWSTQTATQIEEKK